MYDVLFCHIQELPLSSYSPVFDHLKHLPITI